MTPTATEPLSIFPRLAGTRRFTVDEYHRLIGAGVLSEGEKVELLEGYILYKADYPELLPTGTAFPQWQWLRPFTPAEYHRMLDTGIINREEKLELLDGYLVLKMSQNPPHRGAMMRLLNWLPVNLPVGWVYLVNSTVETGVFEPEPDGVVVRGRLSDYDGRNPVPADFGIVIEVSDSTLDMDRRAKGRSYARVEIPVYWIVNLVDRQIEVYSAPDATANPPAYTNHIDYKPGDAVPIVLDGNAVGTIPVADLIA